MSAHQPRNEPVARGVQGVGGIMSRIVTVVLALVTSLILAACADGVGAPLPRTTVEVDPGGDSANPVLVLDDAVARELSLMVLDQAARSDLPVVAQPETDPVFVVVSAPDQTIRIWPDVVQATADGREVVFADDSFYPRVYDAVRDQLGPDVLAALPPTDPAYPELTVTPPPTVGDPGTWVLADPDAVGSDSTSLRLAVTRISCNNGETGEVLQPVVAWSDTQVVIRTDVVRLSPRTADCQGNDAVEVTAELPGPLGERTVLDAVCLEAPTIRYAYCADGAQRWPR